ncbi:4-(cytidine 5'-diphospho)-2-C-methyl-D-erythritol kinase [Shimia sagamensis]|uniref:4-diphosphocytidyl-2-C-methyl-D-erythritol kinase n=1 Tax=Shimia sagamensis TaxID=1566352 RepID=A0ABY1P9S0_9RHOB|nr:4-(cytidine 5'-diphospho)-2-C-methyl-D-erythritol kinase [Shimia sagamensis]SMP29512.1 4-diphosphocytidyl-2-C-methyl-D-erythritol kinase [Shimia sagamensis]
MAIEAFAPAKINLTLHVTGRRADGYHQLDSLVMLTDVGDRLTVERARETSLIVVGAMAAGVPADRSNLVIRAAELLGVSAKITLTKSLPAMAGIGGGSSDGAAAIRALCALYDLPLPDRETLSSLGADVPVCMEPELVRMRGIGEEIDRLDTPPDWSMLLVNPRVSVSTPRVFDEMGERDNPLMGCPFPNWQAFDGVIKWLADQRNDMQKAAVGLQPVIGLVLSELSQTNGCALARMSGSGATCFAIYKNASERDEALEMMRRLHPDWWCVATRRVGARFR